MDVASDEMFQTLIAPGGEEPPEPRRRSTRPAEIHAGVKTGVKPIKRVVGDRP